MKISGKFHLVVAAALLLAAGGAYSRAPTGTISGTVMDESGAVIPNVEVGKADKETGTSRTVRSDASGIFIAPALPSGTYEVKATLTGFRTTATETEMKERKARVEDALHATRAAVEEGIVPGGGVALLRAAIALKDVKRTGDEQIGIDIIRRACEEPCRQISGNAGHEGAIIVEKIRAEKNPM